MAHPRITASFRKLLARAQRLAPSLRSSVKTGDMAAFKGGRAFGFCEVKPVRGVYRITVAPDLEHHAAGRIEGILAHELGHALLMHGGNLHHSERDADEAAEAILGRALYYDGNDVQTTAARAPGARRPRPSYLPQ